MVYSIQYTNTSRGPAAQVEVKEIMPKVLIKSAGRINFTRLLCPVYSILVLFSDVTETTNEKFTKLSYSLYKLNKNFEGNLLI